MGEEKPRPRTRFTQVEAQFPDGAVRQETSANEFSRQPLLPFALERFVKSAASGDLNKDGRSDFVLGGGSGQSARVLLGGERLVFSDVWSLDIEEDFPSADAAFALADFTRDGELDLVAVSGGAALDEGDLGYEDRMYRGDGKGGFARDFESGISRFTRSSGTVAEADFDQDGQVDLFVGGGYVPGRYPESAGSALWRNLGEGEFERVDSEAAAGLDAVGRVSDAVWADLAGDGYQDLIVSKEWGQVELWRNEKGRLSRSGDAFGGTESAGMWTTLEVADFDGDGRLDVAAGNIGLNSGGLWEPSLGPRRLWWKPVGGSVQLIETHLEDGSEWPLAWKDRVAEDRAFRRFSSIGYSAYSERTAFELFGNLEELDFQRLELNEPRSGVFWQQSDGRFTFQAFTTLGQSGRIVDLLASDFDQDGRADLVASMELESLAPWTGRSERGHLLLLSGDSNRQFASELPWSTGLDIGPNSPRSLLWSDFDGDGENELLVALLEGAPLVFKRTSTETPPQP